MEIRYDADLKVWEVTGKDGQKFVVVPEWNYDIVGPAGELVHRPWTLEAALHYLRGRFREI
jgi:hypothetical protein